jgi:hypothetical protein
VFNARDLDFENREKYEVFVPFEEINEYNKVDILSTKKDPYFDLDKTL